MELTGKTALVTGSNTGIGRVTAETLARRGAAVILANRSEAKTAPVVAAITAAGGRAEFLHLDLADFASVRAAAAAVAARHPALHLLINNAGLAGPRGLTRDGFELTFGTNHLGPYLFTRLLLPLVERAGTARIVNVASGSHFQARGFDWEAVRQPTRSFSGMAEYEVSKLANVLFTRELARRLGGEAQGAAGVHTYSLHPGTVATDIWRRVPWGARHVLKLFLLTEEQGAQTTLYCATSDDVAAQSGRYYDKSREHEPSALARDDALALTLWNKSAAWVGLPE